MEQDNGQQPGRKILSDADLLAGSTIIHDIPIPQEVLQPGQGSDTDSPGVVRLRPLNIATLSAISRAARDEVSLIPMLMIKESVIEPALKIEAIRQMHVGLVHFLVDKINQISGLATDEKTLEQSAFSALSQTHILLAKHFGWTPEQVSQLTPGQVAVYLAGIEKFLDLEESK
ncbi:hypothetical protein JXA70_07575 [candidate division KSB1 bacterium]|nr:hypothetical protein [candidate division KSB1 bacterium]